MPDPHQSLDPMYVLSQADRDKFKLLYDDYVKRYGRPKESGGPRPETDDAQQAPEFYATKAPENGIPAIDGTTPGYARCTVYQAVGDPEEKELIEVTGFELDVYNIGSAVAGGEWVRVARDKYGTWHAITSGETSFLALLVEKHYDGNCTRYTWVEVTKDDQCDQYNRIVNGRKGSWDQSPAIGSRGQSIPVVPPEFTGTGFVGTGTGPPTDPAHPYSIVRLRAVGAWTTGADGTGTGTNPGTYYVFEDMPVTMLYKRTGVFDAYGEQAFEYLWNQYTDQWYEGREVRLVRPT